MSITTKEIDVLRQEFMTQAINHRLISNEVARSSGNVKYCNECFDIALENIGRRNLSHIDMPAGLKKDGVRIASTFIQGYLTAKSMESPVSDIVKTYLAYNPNNNLYKIGVSENPSKSVSLLRSIEGGNLEILYVVNEDLESDLRKRFSIQHHASDWFTDDGGSMQAYFKTKSMDIKEEPTDRFAMGAPSVGHAGEEGDK